MDLHKGEAESSWSTSCSSFSNGSSDGSACSAARALCTFDMMYVCVTFGTYLRVAQFRSRPVSETRGNKEEGERERERERERIL
jgi:hypothetical protein